MVFPANDETIDRGTKERNASAKGGVYYIGGFILITILFVMSSSRCVQSYCASPNDLHMSLSCPAPRKAHGEARPRFQ